MSSRTHSPITVSLDEEELDGEARSRVWEGVELLLFRVLSVAQGSLPCLFVRSLMELSQGIGVAVLRLLTPRRAGMLLAGEAQPASPADGTWRTVRIYWRSLTWSCSVDVP